MFYYNRQIVYMDLWKAGERIKTAGFLKLEETDGGLRWQMSIRGLEKTDTGFFDLRDETGALVDKLLLQKGEGRYERSMLAAETTRGGRLFGEICGLRAELTGGRYLKGTWKLSGRREIPESEKAEKEEPKPHPSPKPHPAPNPRPKPLPEPHPNPIPKPRPFPAPDAANETDRLPEPDFQSGMPREAEIQKRPAQKEEERLSAAAWPVFCEDKWEQLKRMYPQIHPFGDERMFLSITPGDFVILGKEYQKMVSNSFLLHGYYNYRHLILGKYPEGEEEGFYLGVPGVCYEREKMAAQMFGFEGFEGKREPAAQGDFGYYMKRVRI